jgi:hypothetical protein
MMYSNNANLVTKDVVAQEHNRSFAGQVGDLGDFCYRGESHQTWGRWRWLPIKRVTGLTPQVWHEN